MLELGLVAEVESLLQRGDLSPKLPSLRTVGYRQAWDHLTGRITYNQMTEQGIAATRQLAKRQLTWLRRYPKKTSTLAGNIFTLNCMEAMERVCLNYLHQWVAERA